jgi:hypothetical protein
MGDESMRGEPGLFDIDERLKRLSDLGDQLLAFAKVVDFKIFRPELLRALAYSEGALAAVGDRTRLKPPPDSNIRNRVTGRAV